MAIFNSYVSLPEGIHANLIEIQETRQLTSICLAHVQRNSPTAGFWNQGCNPVMYMG